MAWAEAGTVGTIVGAALAIGAKIGLATKGDLKDLEKRLAKDEEAYLKGAILKDITGWKDIIDMNGTDITDIKNAPEGFIEFAKSKGAIVRDKSQNESA